MVCLSVVHFEKNSVETGQNC